MMPDLTATTGVPRIAAIERPFGLTIGLPGDAEGHLAVLRAALVALASISQPGVIVELPFPWTYEAKLDLQPPQPPPIVNYLSRRPWALARFFSRTPPPVA